MREELEKKLEAFRERLRDMEYMGSVMNLLDWDAKVNIPEKGAAFRGEVLGYVSNQLYKLQTSDAVKSFLGEFGGIGDLDDLTKAIVHKQKREYDRTMKIPEKRYREYIVATSNSEVAWEAAKKRSDYSLFKPHLKKMIEFNREFIDYWGYDKTKYDVLLDYFEPGITEETIDRAFSELKTAIVGLLARIRESRVSPDASIFSRGFSAAEQESFSRYVLEKIGFDFEAGRLDVSAHPFTTEFDSKDVRITTHYREEEFRTALFGCIHEGGHAIYEQDIPDTLKGTSLKTGVSMGIHESQSRFYENIIGRSRPFWAYFFPEAKKRFPQFADVGLEAFYRGINKVSPSLIRIDADELTYSLHVIIRYEIEKEIFDGGADIDSIRDMWNEKYRAYLGVSPKNDAEGILQDIHWAGGGFGYFPSYVLGNLYGAQFLNAMRRDLPDMDARLAAGDLLCIQSWLKENIHQYGSIYEPKTLLKRVTGEELSAKPYIDYLNSKFGELYEL